MKKDHIGDIISTTFLGAFSGKPKAEEKMVKVIGAGWGRTTTTSFLDAMEILNMKCYHMKEVMANRDAEFWSKMASNPDTDVHEVLGARGFEATCDWPSSQFFDKQLERYPDAKVVLTYRSPEKWYESMKNTILGMMPRCGAPVGVRVAMGVGLPTSGFPKMCDDVIMTKSFQGLEPTKENIIKCYNDHVERVKATVPADKLLVFDVTEHENPWIPLCNFLDLPVPSVPYPHSNDTAEFQRLTSIINIVGWSFVVLGLGIPLLYAAPSYEGKGKPQVEHQPNEHHSQSEIHHPKEHNHQNEHKPEHQK
jgi:hypothetical protein